MRKPLPGEGVVEDEHVDAGGTDLELALDVLLVGIASGSRNEHLGERTGEKYWRLRGSSEPQFAACVNSEHAAWGSCSYAWCLPCAQSLLITNGEGALYEFQ